MHTPDLTPPRDASQMTDLNYEFEPRVPRVLQSKDETKAFYDKIAGVYDLLIEFNEQPIRNAGLELFAAAPGETILEIGCGTGRCLVELARSVGPKGKVLGIDISQNMLDETQKLFTQESVELHCCDAARLPFADGTLDGIFTSFTLELFDTPALPEVLSEWQRVLKQGGRLVVVSISRVDPQGLFSKPFEWTHRHLPNLMDCCPIYVRHELEASGFCIEHARVEYMWAPVEIVHGVKLGCTTKMDD